MFKVGIRKLLKTSNSMLACLCNSLQSSVGQCGYEPACRAHFLAYPPTLSPSMVFYTGNTLGTAIS